MTPAFSTRRRADEFEALLSRSEPAPLTERDVREFAALLAVVEDLRAIPEVTARPEFVGGLREQLMAAADTALAPAGDAVRDLAPLGAPLRTPRRHRHRRLSVLLGGAALVGATATVAVAAQTALPGESLYPVKRGLESAQLQFVSGADRGTAQLAHATDRLTELEALSAESDARTTTLTSDTLRSFADQADEGAGLLLDAYADTDDRALVEQVHDFNVTSMGRLTDLEAQLPEASQDDLVAAAQTLVELDARAREACTACSGGIGSMRTPTALDVDVSDPSTDEVASPVTGQDVEGIEVPDLEVPDDLDPSAVPPLASPTQTPLATKTPGEAVSGTTDKVKDDVKETVKGTPGTVDEVTGTLGGVTEGTVNAVTDGLGYLSGGLTGNATDGVGSVSVIPSPGAVLPGASLPDVNASEAPLP